MKYIIYKNKNIEPQKIFKKLVFFISRFSRFPNPMEEYQHIKKNYVLLLIKF